LLRHRDGAIKLSELNFRVGGQRREALAHRSGRDREQIDLDTGDASDDRCPMAIGDRNGIDPRTEFDKQLTRGIERQRLDVITLKDQGSGRFGLRGPGKRQ